MSAIRLARAATGREKIAQVRRRLPRPRRRPARRGRLRPRHARASPPSPGVPEAAGRGDRGRAVERPATRCARALERARARRDPRRALPGEHGPRPAAPRASSSCCASCADDARRAARLRRGDHRLPRRPRRRAGAAPASLPDLTVLGKVIGGGLPAAAYGGPARADGADRAGRRRLPGRHAVREPARGRRRASPRSQQLDEEAYLRARATRPRALADGLREAAGDAPASRSAEHHRAADRLLHRGAGARLRRRRRLRHRGATRAWCRALLARGVYPPPSQFEAWFPSLAHTTRARRAHARGRRARRSRRSR